MTPSAASGRRSREPVIPHRPLPRPRPRVADALAVLAGLGLGLVIALFVHGETRATLLAPGGWQIAIARFSGFTGTYLMLVMLILIARIPWLERTVGQDRLVRWHRKIGPWPLWLISNHVLFILIGYAKLSKTGIFSQAWTFIHSYPDILASFVAYGLLMMAGLTSINIARRRLKYETWWVVHLYLYLALALAFAHQIKTGVSFITSPINLHIWSGVWIATAALVAVFRVGLPIYRNMRHQLRVASIREEAPGVYSVICTGRHIERLAIAGGQFFLWRFLAKDLWWHAHPYSLSALPRPPYVRFTVKALGDQSSAIELLKPGTRVLVEGPYGAFTRHVRRSNKVALIGAGVGVTPLRALLEDLPMGVDVEVIIRSSTKAELVHGDEISALVEARHGRYHPLIGSRSEIRLDSRTLRALVPDIAERDIYLCGPESFNEIVTKSAERLGADPERVHHEAFSF
ncbi:MAG TPA: ferric reductase-like transmembrane domain-containing protein [Acidimicrobiales bacterium]|nr:ferric reductase-like transmembrane domain-containing protein [Acidimicrobiales bacterium]